MTTTGPWDERETDIFEALHPTLPETAVTDRLFLSLDSPQIASEISRAESYVCYAAPGILDAPAEALATLARRLRPDRIVVCLDFDERVLRMGFGTLSAAKTLRAAGLATTTTPGLRTGLLIVDGDGYVFSPTALYLEADSRSPDAPNALRLSHSQVTEALARLSPAAKTLAAGATNSEEERQQIEARQVEVPSTAVDPHDFDQIEKRLTEAPPVPFDIARQVRVYSAYLQYVEIEMAGAAIQRRRLALPPTLQGLTDSGDLARRLKTTFDLIERNDRLSSRTLESDLNKIRQDFTRPLGKGCGRVVLKSAKPYLEDRLQHFRDALDHHRQRVGRELQDHLHQSREQIVEHFLPRIVASPPDRLRGRLPHIDEESIQRWLGTEVDRFFPTAESLVAEMRLDVRYKDVTFETLKRKDFLEAVNAAFPGTDWEKAHEEFRAAGEQRGSIP